ncbi:FkbH like protein [Herpetosiphon aurantiacus DSM 785]|uniref:FkbH like protein n=1 Tax=Herpetosiphon aurantiacus (strain ATCC 23779 / DSM 785 / 114-95) TaxID=316274 RepID=A9AV15_HERA2|nr:FkbH like protein [Herpetosiphon aurantiacus DSM 785]HCE70941.1 HAD-IIIC family phosphatase [Ruegeria sp.]
MAVQQTAELIKEEKKNKSVKCVVWDLDNTVWKGILLEDEHVTPFPNVVAVIKELDSRGILNSISSRNDHDLAVAKLEELGLLEYFLYPQINWNSKASSIKEIAKLINIGLDTFAFVDDQPFEREEVTFEIPDILCIDALDGEKILDMPEMMPRFITEDSRLRRQMYQSDISRNGAEQEFQGSNEEFLATLKMVFTLAPAQEDDLQRAEELTLRTNQLNTTGYTYSYDELNAFRHSGRHKLYIASLDDKYGTYGKIGLTLVECGEEIWTIKLLLMSCRVMSRGVGTIMINHVMNECKRAGRRLQAEFVSNNRNRMMYITYKFGGFNEVNRIDDLVIFENDLSNIQPFPEYVKVNILD